MIPTLAAALPLWLTATTSAADMRESSQIDQLTDIVTVAATKRQNPEDLQTVPLAVTAFDEVALDALNVRDLEDLTFSVPNVSLDDIGTFRGHANFTIRGLGINSSIGSVDPAVGVFIDGVYLGINAGIVFDMFDLESVEILRGPQGTLFGRNTTGGAVLINTQNPTDTFEAKARVAVETPVGNDRGGINSFAMGTVSGPIIKGKLHGKFGAYLNRDEGYFENQFNGNDFGEATTSILRGGLEWKASETFTVLLKADYFDTEGDGNPSQNRGLFERDNFDLSLDEPGFIEAQAITASLRTDWQTRIGTFTNIYGYRDYQQDTLNDVDGTPIFSFNSDTQTEQEQFSSELRYATRWGRADIVLGTFYFDQDSAVNENRTFLLTDRVSVAQSTGGGRQDHTVTSIFGQVDYDLTTELTLIAGARWSREEKAATIAYVQGRPEPCDVLENTCAADDIATDGFRDRDEWQNISPKFGLQWTPDKTVNLYATFTRGFRSGGYNFRTTGPSAPLNLIAAQGGDIATDEEITNSYEIGMKLQTPDGRGQFNGAFFVMDVDDMQREVNVSDPEAGIAQVIVNTADATITGVEFEAQYRLFQDLLVTFNYGHLDAEYDSVRFDISTDGVVDDQDTQLAIPRVPENTYGASLIHEAHFGAQGTVVSRLSFQHRDRLAYTDSNFGFIQDIDALDFDVTWITPWDGLQLSVYGANMLDQVQAGGDSQIPFGGTTRLDGSIATTGPRSNGTNEVFGTNPAFGTISPLKKGRLIGLEATYRF
ncbi:MAG: TonB-dependent receptor [Pseudomonadota bacterium]